MFLKIYTAIILFVLIVLNFNIHKNASPEIQEELKPYVNTFLDYCDYYHVDCDSVYNFKITMTNLSQRSELLKWFGLPNGNVIGRCYYHSNEIEIDEWYYYNSKPIEIEQLIIHELGHCILDLEHTEETELSIMNPYSIPDYMYLEHYNKMMNVFFGCKENCPGVTFDQNRY